jgi:hypothetical protein
MSFTVDWVDSQHTVIHANFINHWDWSELYGALENAHKLMLKSNRHITLMLDFVGSAKATRTDALFSIADEVIPPANLVRIIIVSDDTVLGEKMSDLLRRFYPDAQAIHNTESHQEASEIIHEVAAT